jgi:hypothetical protein
MSLHDFTAAQTYSLNNWEFSGEILFIAALAATVF